MKNVTFYKFDIEPRNNLRVDQLLASYLPEYSRSRIKNWINDDKILINGKSCSPKDKLITKSLVEIEIRPTEELDIISEDIPLEPLYEDDAFLIINKPSGMVTHTAVSNYSGTLLHPNHFLLTTARRNLIQFLCYRSHPLSLSLQTFCFYFYQSLSLLTKRTDIQVYRY